MEMENKENRGEQRKLEGGGLHKDVKNVNIKIGGYLLFFRKFTFKQH